jgi:hypothetical protein
MIFVFIFVYKYIVGIYAYIGVIFSYNILQENVLMLVEVAAEEPLECQMLLEYSLLQLVAA